MTKAERERQTKIHREWLDACIEEDHRLSKWELGFIASLTEWMEDGSPLTEDQAKTLERIYAQKTS